MSDLFKNCVKISLSEHITTHTPSRLTAHGGKFRHVNPCPLCGHNDCFALVPATNSFKCWSCDKAGDIINFERHRLNLSSNEEAAKALSTLYGIPFDGPYTPPPAMRRPEPQPDAKATRENPLPEIEQSRAKGLRGVTAAYFHGLLMKSPDAIAYQTGHRKHDINTLIERQIGLSDANTRRYVDHITNAGYTEAEAVSIGVLGLPTKEGGRVWLKISKGIYVYPHLYKGEVLHFTLKDPNPDKSQRKKWQLVRAGADPEWLLYNQDALDAPTVFLVEGENDAITCIRHGWKATAAIIGNSNNDNIKAWIAHKAAGKTFFLAFDPDEAGAKYFAAYAKAIMEAGGILYSLEDRIKKEADDIDAILRASADPDALAQELVRDAVRISDINLVPSVAGISTPRRRTTMDEYGFDSFEVLGETDTHAVCIWSGLNRDVYTLSLKELTYDALVQFGGPDIVQRVARKATEDMIFFAALKQDIILEAAKTRMGKAKNVGQGLHMLRSDRMLIVNGGEAWIWDGKTMTAQEHPVIEGKMIELSPGHEWIDMEDLMAELAKMTPERAMALYEKFADLFGQWGFAGKLDVLMVTGWILAQIVQQAWDWRPHMWLTGAQGSGKTLLAQLIDNIGGKLVLRKEGSGLTEPGFRQELHTTSLMTIIDEFEKSADRDKIITVLRSAGREGYISKGSPSGTAVNYFIRHMVLCCSIETGLERAAEKNRYIIINTSKDNRYRPELPNTHKAQQIKNCMVAYALWGMYPARQLVRDHGPVPGEDNRFVESVCVPLAMGAIATPNPLETLRTNAADYMQDLAERSGGGMAEDEVGLLQDILSIRLRVLSRIDATAASDGKIIYVDRTIGQLLTEDPMTESTYLALQTNGVRSMKDGDIFIRTESITPLLATSAPRWKGLNIKDLLLRLPGAEHANRRLGGVGTRGIDIPYETWDPPIVSTKDDNV